MSQMRLEGGFTDPIAMKVNANFDELYAAKTGDEAAIVAAQADATLALSAGIPFRATTSLTSIAAAAGSTILLAASVPAGKKAVITGMILNVNGGTAWTDVTATGLTIQDTASSPVLGLTIDKALLIANAVIGLTSLGIVLANPVTQGIGFTTAKGLTIKGDGNFAAGSTIYVTLVGYLI
jgi:hypothetical protein